MRPTPFAVAVAAFLVAGCAAGLHVKTLAAPDAGVATLSTFRVLPVPPPRHGRPLTEAYDPMVNNSITNRALRETVTQGFSNRGYVVNERAPDFAVAVYASAYEKLDVTAWNYGYSFWPRSRWNWNVRQLTTEDTEYPVGTVIIDVIRASDRELLWRGSATARMWEDPPTDVKELQKVAAAIVKKFPVAQGTRVATN
jgi:uncharacterized protein DUF4136